MKKLVVVLIVMLLSVALLFDYAENSSDYLRLHVRANSDSEVDLAVKMEVKELVSEHLSFAVSKGLTFDESEEAVRCELSNLQRLIDDFLELKGFDYSSSVSLENEYFPSRKYGVRLFESGEYDAVVVRLGEGVGENWWCVVYPPLCFIEGKDIEGEEIVYKSKIKELLDKFVSSES